MREVAFRTTLFLNYRLIFWQLRLKNKCRRTNKPRHVNLEEITMKITFTYSHEKYGINQSNENFVQRIIFGEWIYENYFHSF